jgi:hypothetical protein
MNKSGQERVGGGWWAVIGGQWAVDCGQEGTAGQAGSGTRAFLTLT